jgi:hypothetical protein
MLPPCLTARAKSSCRALHFINDTGDWGPPPVAVAPLKKDQLVFHSLGRLLPATAAGAAGIVALGMGREP